MENELDYLDFDDDFDGDIINQDPTLEGNDNLDTLGNNLPVNDEKVVIDNDDDYVQPSSILEEYLAIKGIKDVTAIKQLDEDGVIKEVNFYDLDKEEQLNILNSKEESNELDNDELTFINTLRDSNISIQEYLEYVQNKAISDYLETNKKQEYSVDSLSDEELYVIDLQDKIENLTPEEASSFLDHEKANESLWEKKIEMLRKAYKQKEQDLIEQEGLIKQQQEEQEREQFSNTMLEAINNLQTIETFDLEDSDKDRIAEFVLGSDATGTNYMYKALQDPESVAKIAWFLLEGTNSIKALNDYWKKQIQEYSRTNYESGYNDAKSGKISKNTKTVVNKKPNNKTSANNIISLNREFTIDLD